MCKSEKQETLPEMKSELRKQLIEGLRVSHALAAALHPESQISEKIRALIHEVLQS